MFNVDCVALHCVQSVGPCSFSYPDYYYSSQSAAAAPSVSYGHYSSSGYSSQPPAPHSYGYAAPPHAAQRQMPPPLFG